MPTTDPPKTTRDQWVGRVVGQMGPAGFVDGVFVDGNRDKWSSGVTSLCDKDAKAAWSDGLNATMWQLRAECDKAGNARGCTIISNYATDAALQMSDGGMIERFGCAVNNIAQLAELTSEGFLVQVHAQSATSAASLQQCVACFLVGANEGAYFGAGNGWEG